MAPFEFHRRHNSPELELTVASTAQLLSSFPSSRLVFSVAHCYSGDDATVPAGPVWPERGRAPPCAMAEPLSSMAGVLKGQ